MSFIIHKGTSGLGHIIREITFAAIYAHATNRTLLIDWRNSLYHGLPKEQNVFPLVFDGFSNTINFDIVTSENEHQYKINNSTPDNIIWDNWRNKDANELHKIHKTIQHATSNLIVNNFENIISNKKDVLNTEYVWGAWGFDQIFVQNHYQKSPLIQWYCSYILNSLKLKPRILDIISSYKKQYFNQPTIGIHIRHGNGEKGNFISEKRVINNVNLFVNDLIDQLKCLGKKLYNKNYQIFLATDSQIIIDLFLKSDCNLIIREKWLPKANEGGFIAANIALDKNNTPIIQNPIQSLEDAIIDMHLLSHCDIVSLSDRSAFSFLPYILQENKRKTIFRKFQKSEQTQSRYKKFLQFFR